MKALHVVMTSILAGGLLLAGCGQKNNVDDEPASQTSATNSASPSQQQTAESSQQPNQAAEVGTDDFVGAVKELVTGLKQEAESGKVDWAKAKDSYVQKVQAVVQARDTEAESHMNDQLEAALKAGEEGALSGPVVAQLFDKLLQKTAFLSLRHDFKEANEKFTDKDFAKKEIQEAREIYDGILKGMVEKRDNAYNTQLLSVVDGGFGEMEQAVEKGDNLSYNLGKQLVDKTLMKAFYLASGAEKGYGYKIEKAVKEGGDDPRAEQAEGWAFFQSLKPYLEEFDKEAADYIESQFDLSNEAKNVKGDLINQAFIRGFAATAKGEYGETFANWGKDKSVITALEGALFIDVIRADLAKALGGEAQANTLVENSQKLLDRVKAGNKEQAEKLYKAVEAALNKLAKYGK